MSPEYAFSCPSGLRDVLRRHLTQDPKWKDMITPVGGDESLLVFTANLPPSEVSKLPFPSFLVISQKEFPPSTPINQIANTLVNPKILSSFRRNINPHHRSFRFMVSIEGRLLAIDPNLRRKIENQIQKTFHLQHNPHKAKNEFWIVVRRDGLSFFGLRLRVGGEREKGELSAAVTYLLNAFSQPKPNDVFLDPFAGTGAIAASRAEYFPAQRIIAFDNNPQLLKKLEKRLKRYPNTHVSLADALNMNTISDSSIDVIVTDPPWGEYQPLPFSPSDFYQKMLEEFKRIIKRNGRVVVLMGRSQEENFEEAVKSTKFSITEKLNVLVAGRKAAVYLLTPS